MALSWGDIKDGYNATTDFIGDIPVVGSVARATGLSGTKDENLSEDAQAAIGPSSASAQAAFAAALAQAQNAGLIQTPTAVSAAPIFAPTYTPTMIDRTGLTSDPLEQAKAYNYAAQGYNAKTAQAVGAGSSMVGYDAALARAVETAAVNPAEVRDVRTDVRAPTMEEAAQANRVQVGNAYIDPFANATRDESLAAARSIAAGPSSATAQFKSSMDKATADALAVAAQARGAERAGARREAIIQMALKGGASAEAAAATAAQEEQAKRVASAAAIQNVRGADVSVAQTQAQIDAQRAQTQAQLDSAIEQGNTAAVNELRKQKATLDLQAQTVSTQAALQQQATQAGLQKANLDAGTTRSIADAANANDIETANAAARTKAAADLAAAKNLAEREYAVSATGVNTGNAAAETKAAADLAAAINEANKQYSDQMSLTSRANATMNAQQAENNTTRVASANTTDAATRNTMQTKTADALIDASKTGVSNTLKAGEINANTQLDAEKIRQAAITSGVSGMNTAASTQGSNAQTVTGAQRAEAGAQTKQDAATVGVAGAVAQGLIGGEGGKVVSDATKSYSGAYSGDGTSDERAKSNISRVSDGEIADLAEKLNAYTYRFKPGFEDGGQYEHGGPMAQDIERSALGKKFVHEDPTGTKHVDVLSLAGLMAAAAARSIRKNSKEKRT